MIGPAGHEIQNSSYSPKKTKWLDIGDYSIFLVDGEEIRSNQAIDFTQGGHHKVFPFIPEGEVWIERMKDSKEQYYTLVHELKEIKDMQKESYDTAHPKANELELKTRKEAKSKLPYFLAALAASGAGVAALKAQKEPVMESEDDADWYGKPVSDSSLSEGLEEVKKGLQTKNLGSAFWKLDPASFGALARTTGRKNPSGLAGFMDEFVIGEDPVGVAAVKDMGNEGFENYVMAHEAGHLKDVLVSPLGERRGSVRNSLSNMDYLSAMKEAEKYGYSSPEEFMKGEYVDRETAAEEFANELSEGKRTRINLSSVPEDDRTVARFKAAEDEAYMKNSSLTKEAAVREILKDLVAGAFSGLGSGLAAGVAVILYDKLQKDRKKRERKLSALADTIQTLTQISGLSYAYKLRKDAAFGPRAILNNMNKEAGWFKKAPVPKPTVIGEMHKAIPQMSMGKLLTANTLALLVAAGLMGVAEGAGMNAYDWGKEKYLDLQKAPPEPPKEPSEYI